MLITKELTLKLREETGLSLRQCLFALRLCCGDIEMAKTYLISYAGTGKDFLYFKKE